MIDNFESHDNRNGDDNNSLDILSNMPSFDEHMKNMGQTSPSEMAQPEAVIDSLREDTKGLKNEVKNLERQTVWRDILTDLKDSIDNIQPGDAPDKWKKVFLNKGYEVHAITSDTYNESIPKPPKPKEHLFGYNNDGEPVTKTTEQILNSNRRLEDYWESDLIDYNDDNLATLAENGVSKKDLYCIYEGIFYKEPSEKNNLASMTEKYFGKNVPSDQRALMSSIMQKGLYDMHRDEYELNSEDPTFTPQEVDFMAQKIAIESGLNASKINEAELDTEGLEVLEETYQYDVFLGYAFGRIDYYDSKSGQEILEKARAYAANPGSIQINQATDQATTTDLGDTPQTPELARPDQKRILIDKIDKDYPYTIFVFRGESPKREFGGFSYHEDKRPNVDSVGFAGETSFGGEHPDMSKRIDNILGELFNNNVFSYAENNGVPEHSESYPDASRKLAASFEIGQILNGMKSKAELATDISRITMELDNKEKEITAIKKREEEAKNAEIEAQTNLKESEEYKILSEYNKSFNFGGYGGISDENLEDLAERLIEKGHLEKVRKEFGNEGMKKIGVFENSMTFLTTGEDDYDVANRLYDDLESLAETYCSGKELSENQEAILEMAHERINMLPLERDELAVLFSDDNDNDVLAKIVRSGLGVDVGVMKQLLAK